MSRLLRYQIPAACAGMTVLEYLKSLGYTRHLLTRLKETPDGLLLNGVKPFGRTILQEGHLLTVKMEEKKCSDQILPVPMDLSILYEDEDLMVINKAADTPIHPSRGNYENTLANGVAWYFKEKGEPFVYRCINRLDRDTTGALILAKHAFSASLLSRQVKERKISRTYLAITEGIVPDSGTITLPIARKRDSAIEREVNLESGEYACTHFERLSSHNGLSLVQLNLDTGRTHQIRVHMKYIGFPLIGDYLYNPNYQYIRRQALHSYQLSFLHPITGKEMLFTAPVPDDFAAVFSQ